MNSIFEYSKTITVNKDSFVWIGFYSEFAEKLLPYMQNRKNLIEKIKNIYTAANMQLPTLEKDNNLTDIDPFTVFGLFNKGITDANRIAILREIAQTFSVKAPIPGSFKGVPVLNNKKATFYSFADDRKTNDIDNLWKIFAAALNYAKFHSKESKAEFIKNYNLALLQKGVKWNLTMALYWISPQEYINLDSRNRWFILNPENMPLNFINGVNNFNTVPDGEQYLKLCELCRNILKNGNYRYKNFAELSYYSWIVSEEANKQYALLKQEAEKQQNILFGQPEKNKNTESRYPAYTKTDFLNEVYINENDYQTLINLLNYKKNIIIQGAPGVGKTFAAQKLAYSIIKTQDPDRIKMIQFHQNYSYEDFIMGFRPSPNGFELKKGPFYNFCKKAEADSENKYFFIIDEINRGNLSKIFGELFMLIENDKRGIFMPLVYSDEEFSVPANLNVIGIMNTADRSLALLDYALRRRFAFFEFSPAFESEGFRSYQKKKNNKKFDKLIAAVKELNTAIENDETLGKGFRIGHSYFCTENNIDDIWLTNIVNYEIIPLLNEYWFDEPNKVQYWETRLRECIR